MFPNSSHQIWILQTEWNFQRKATKTKLFAIKSKVKINEKFEINEINFNLDSQ